MKKCIVQIGINLICGLVSGSIVSAVIMPKLERSEYFNAVLLSGFSKKNLDFRDVDRMLEWGIENKIPPTMLIDSYKNESKAHRGNAD